MKKILAAFFIMTACAQAVNAANAASAGMGIAGAPAVKAGAASTAAAGPAAGTASAAVTAVISTPAVISAPAVTSTSAVTSTAAAASTPAATPDEGESLYNSLTSTADFSVKPVFEQMKYEKNYPIQDAAVSAVEAVPFGFLFTFAGIFLDEAYNQHTWSPKLKPTNDYTGVYEIAISGFALVNIGVNMLFYYDYKKEGSNAEKTEKK